MIAAVHDGAAVKIGNLGNSSGGGEEGGNLGDPPPGPDGRGGGGGGRGGGGGGGGVFSVTIIFAVEQFDGFSISQRVYVSWNVPAAVVGGTIYSPVTELRYDPVRGLGSLSCTDTFSVVAPVPSKISLSRSLRVIVAVLFHSCTSG